MTEAMYFGAEGRQLFGMYHRPRGPLRRGAGVVLCNPIGDDCVRAHRTLRHLADQLALVGFPVLRFDFHGTGDSPGDERLADRVPHWLEDVPLAVDELRRRAGVVDVAVVGLRLGATLALAALAAAGGVETIVLYAPFVSGAAFAAESIRSFKMHKMLTPDGFKGGPRKRDDGEEAFGFLLTHETVAQLRDLDLGRLSSQPDRRVLLRALLIGDGTAPAADEAIAERLRSLGVSAERTVVPRCQQVLVEIPHKSSVPEDALQAIVDYLVRHHGTPGTGGPLDRRGTLGPIEVSAEPTHEAPATFGERLFGIHHQPLGAGSRPMPVVLVSAGTVHRIGPHRLYVTLARQLAAAGFHVLRFDLSGIGDSAAETGEPENLTYPRSGFSDVRAALDYLEERTQLREFVVAGLCSGGDFAFYVAQRDPRVRGAVLLNPRTFFANDLDEGQRLFARVEGFQDAQAIPVPDGLRSLSERGVDTLLVTAERDPGIDYVEHHYGEEMRLLASAPGFRRETIPGTDHHFTSLWAQEVVCSMVVQHLTERFSR